MGDELAGSIFSALGNVLTNAFLIMLTVVFILLEVADFPKKLRRVLKNPERSLSTIKKFSRSAKRYLVIKTLVSAAVGLVIWLWLLILGVDYPVLWRTLSFLLNYVPNIGAIIAELKKIIKNFGLLGQALRNYRGQLIPQYIEVPPNIEA